MISRAPSRAAINSNLVTVCCSTRATRCLATTRRRVTWPRHSQRRNREAPIAIFDASVNRWTSNFISSTVKVNKLRPRGMWSCRSDSNATTNASYLFCKTSGRELSQPSFTGLLPLGSKSGHTHHMSCSRTLPLITARNPIGSKMPDTAESTPLLVVAFGMTKVKKKKSPSTFHSSPIVL